MVTKPAPNRNWYRARMAVRLRAKAKKKTPQYIPAKRRAGGRCPPQADNPNRGT